MCESSRIAGIVAATRYDGTAITLLPLPPTHLSDRSYRLYDATRAYTAASRRAIISLSASAISPLPRRQRACVPLLATTHSTYATTAPTYCCVGRTLALWRGRRDSLRCNAPLHVLRVSRLVTRLLARLAACHAAYLGEININARRSSAHRARMLRRHAALRRAAV